MSYLRYLCFFGSFSPPVVCMSAHVLFTLFVFVRFVFPSSCLYECSCLIYVICVCSVRFPLQLFVWVLMSYLRYLCLFAYSGVQYILCCVFLRIVCHMLPVYLACPFSIAPSVFSNVYFKFIAYHLFSCCNLNL